jgi:hypothetical protein
MPRGVSPINICENHTYWPPGAPGIYGVDSHPKEISMSRTMATTEVVSQKSVTRSGFPRHSLFDGTVNASSGRGRLPTDLREPVRIFVVLQHHVNHL